MRQEAFHRRSRLLNASDFQRVFEKPASSTDKFFKVLARPNALGYSRLGLAVSRKIDPRAVVRNRIKRTVRESFRKDHGLMDAAAAAAGHRPPRDYVVLPTKVAATISNDRLRQSLERHWCELDRKLAEQAEQQTK